jgi:SAM-dependent methyltransferase
MSSVREQDFFVEVACCPGCGSGEFASGPVKGSSFETLAGKRSFEQPEYEIRICDQCGLYYKSNVLSAAELASYYDEVDFTKWDIGKLFPSEKAILKILNELPAGSKVLDYGCSDGRLLSHLGDSYQKFGVEINEKAAAVAAQKQIKMLSVDDVCGKSLRSFDAIVLSDVFEHLVHPTEVLQSLRERLSEGGLLILFTGDGEAKASRRDIANFWYFRTLEHLCMFSRKHAQYLSQRLHLELVSWTQMSHYDYTLREIARQYFQDFAYSQFHHNGPSFLTSLLKITPVLRRAQHWATPPEVTYTKDHVLAVFQRPNK